MASNTADIILRFITERGGADAAKKVIDEIQAKVAGAGKQGAYGQTDFFSQLGASATAAAPKIDAVSKSIAGLGKSAIPAGRSWVGDLDEAGKDLETFSKQIETAMPQIEKYIKARGFRKTGEHVPAAMREINDVVQETGMSFEEATKQVTGFDENLNKVGGTIEKTGETAKKTGRNIYALFGGFGSFFLSFAGKDLAKFGQSILSPLTKFIALASGSGVGAAWANNTKRVENSITRIGAVMAETFLPALKKAAELSEKIATFAEAHPQLVTAAAGLGMASLAIGKLLTLAGSLGMLGSALTTMGVFKLSGTGSGLVMGGMFKAAEGQAIGETIGNAIAKSLGMSGVGMTLGKAIGLAFLKYAVIPLGAAVAAWEIWKLGEKTVQRLRGVPEKDIKTSELSDLKRNAQYALAAGIFNLSAIVEGWKKFNGEAPKTRQELAKLALAIAGLGNASATSPEAVDAYAQYDKQRVEMEAQYEEQRTQIVTDAGAARVELEAKYEEDRSNILAQYGEQSAKNYADYQKSLKSLESDFLQSGIDLYKDYQESLSKLQSDYRDSEVDAAKDHQERLRKLAQEHADNVERLTNSRDALGLAQENRDYKRKVSEENREFKEAEARRKREYKQQQAELQQKYAEDEAKRKAEYERQKAELLANYQEQAIIIARAMSSALEELDKKHAEEEKKLKETEKKQLSELEAAHNKQEKELTQSLNDQLNALDVWTGGMKTKYTQYYEDMKAALQKYIDETQAMMDGMSGSAPGMASGGYVSGGLYQMHPGEFVMNPNTTSLAERLTSGRLTQGNIIGALAHAGNIVINQTLRFSGELGANDKRQIQRIAKESAMHGLESALGV